MVEADWIEDLERWLEPFVERLGAQGAAADVPARAGLIGPGDRKSVRAMADRFVPGEV